MIVSGLTYLAYKHPVGYKKLSNVLMIILISFAALTMSFDTGIKSFYYDISVDIRMTNSELADRVKTRMEKITNPDMILTVSCLVAAGGLYLLQSLQHLTNEKKDKPK